MSPFSEIIYNENVKRQIFLTRNKKSAANKVVAIMREHDLDYAERFASSFARLSSKDLVKLSRATKFNTKRLMAFKSALVALSKSSAAVLTAFIDKEFDELTVDEFKFQYDLVNFAKKETGINITALKSLKQSDIKKYRSLEPMVYTTQSDYIEHWSRGRSEKVLRAVRKGLKRGKSVSEIIKSISGTEKRFSGVLKDTHHGAKIIVNTLHVSATSAANFAFIDNNTDFDLLVSAILDTGSSKVCVFNHNKFVFEDLNGERSPYHFNCNTRVFPFLRGEDAPAKENVAAWWNRQDDEFKLKFLGPVKFAAQKDAPRKLSDVRDFISPEKGDFFTLEELRDSGKI